MAKPPDYSAWQLFRMILAPERSFYLLMLIYGIAISALTLSVPLSVQVLIGTVVNAAVVQQVFVLSLVLFALLVLSGLFAASQAYLMELFERRFFSRIFSDVSLRLLYARPDFMERINRDELVNRYFDIMTVQKSLPTLLTGALATALQATVGIMVTSFYHPIFLGFNVAVVLLAYLIFRMFDRGAQRTAISLSDQKYYAAQWLETLARTNSFFKSNRTVAYALDRTEVLRDNYVREHRRHFHYTFGQIVVFLALYAAVSAALLGIGGWLVILGELTIGQLVAAELIFSAIFYSLTRTGYYLELYYDLYAAMYKLLQLFRIAEEQPRRVEHEPATDSELRFNNVAVELESGEFIIDFHLPSGRLCMLETASSQQIRAISSLLVRFREPHRGRILLGNVEISSMSVRHLRDEIVVIDNASFPESAIADYLAIAAPDMTRKQMTYLLGVVGLGGELGQLDGGLDQVLTAHGYPLSVSGVIKLKIAFALAAAPKVLVLTPLFDALNHESRKNILQYIRDTQTTSLLCFSHRHDLHEFDDYFVVDFTEQRRYASIAELDAYQNLRTGA